MSSPNNFPISEWHWQTTIATQKWTCGDQSHPAEWHTSTSQVTGSRSSSLVYTDENPKKEPNILVANRWLTQMRIGSGSFGDVYQGLDITTGEGVAIKIESATEDHPTLINEANVYDALAYSGHATRFAKMFCYRDLGDETYAMVMQRLGKSLEDIRKGQPDSQLPIDQVIQVGIQCVHALDCLHEAGYIHCDVKPDNILAGVGYYDGKYFLVDFGLATELSQLQKSYTDDDEMYGFVGTTMYASVNVHDGGAPSEKCDLESLAYSLSEMFHGELPWSGIERKGMSKKEWRRVIAEKKRGSSAKELFRGMGEGFERFFEDICSLKVGECPRYRQLRSYLIEEQSRWI